MLRFCPADPTLGQTECHGCERSEAYEDGLCCETCKEEKEKKKNPIRTRMKGEACNKSIYFSCHVFLC